MPVSRLYIKSSPFEDKMPPKGSQPAPIPPKEVLAAWRRPIPISTTTRTRNSLLPYLALGFTPTHTSGHGLLCGTNALHRSYRDARIALRAPSDPPLRHPTQREFRDLLDGPIYGQVITEYLVNFIDAQFTDEMVEEQTQALRRPAYFDINTLTLLLEAANR